MLMPPPETETAEPQDACCWRSADRIREVACETCGDSHKRVDVYRCDIFGECVRTNFRRAGSKTQPERVCMSCDQRATVPPKMETWPENRELAIADPAREVVADPPIVRPAPVAPQPHSHHRRIVLKTNLPPGDIMTLTAAVHSLHETYPGRFKTAVDTPAGKAIWENNPHVESASGAGWETIEMEYPSIHRSNQESTQFLGAYTAFLGEKLGVPLALKTNRPMLYLSEQERGWTNQVIEHKTDHELRKKIGASQAKVPFWLINAGVKRDFTAKQWPPEHYQEVVSRTEGLIQWVQIGRNEDLHVKLSGVISLVGETDLRQLIRLGFHARGGLGPVTFLQHLMAAHQRPYVCILGGREPVPWVQYQKQHTFHSIGLLPCCQDRACWKARTVPVGDGDEKDKNLCEAPVYGKHPATPACMAMIRPKDVVATLERIVLSVARGL